MSAGAIVPPEEEKTSVCGFCKKIHTPLHDDGIHVLDEVCAQCVADDKSVAYISMGSIQHPIRSYWLDLWYQLRDPDPDPDSDSDSNSNSDSDSDSLTTKTGQKTDLPETNHRST
jgi:hypothetical protein